jgi:hypothetical protein
VAVVRGTDRRNVQFLSGDRTAIMRRFYAEPCVIVSESFTRRHRMRDGDLLELPTPQGPRQFPIAGTFYDYTRDQGIVYMSQTTFLPIWNDDRVHSLAVYLKPGGSAAEVSSAFRAQMSAGQFITFSKGELRRTHLRDFRSDVRGHVCVTHDRGHRRDHRHLPDADDADYRANARAGGAARDRRKRRRSCESCCSGNRG